MIYHNTLAHEGETLRTYQQKAMSQDELILAFFMSQPFGTGFTPSEILDRVMPQTPITSVRRSMNTLTNRELLVKTSEQRIGWIYNRPETIWRLAGPVQKDLF